MQAELVLDARNATGESPVWHAAEQALYWVDIPARQLHRLVPATGAHSNWTGDEMLACIAPRADHPGQWIAGMESGLFAIATRDDGTLAATPVARRQFPRANGMRFNDGRCDFARPLSGSAAMLHATWRPAAHRRRVYRSAWSDVNALRCACSSTTGLIVPATAWPSAPDGRSMWLSDSHPSVQAIWRAST
jgi:sugar lactone lactonase YvrE